MVLIQRLLASTRSLFKKRTKPEPKFKVGDRVSRKGIDLTGTVNEVVEISEGPDKGQYRYYTSWDIYNVPRFGDFGLHSPWKWHSEEQLSYVDEFRELLYEATH